MLRPIELSECTVELTFEHEADIKPEDSFDQKEDQETIDWIYSELEAGNPYAWCYAKCTVTWAAPDGTELEGTAYIGSICANNEKEARETADEHSLAVEALGELNRELEAKAVEACTLFALRMTDEIPEDMRLFVISVYMRHGKDAKR